jgi:hypothetical protein
MQKYGDKFIFDSVWGGASLVAVYAHRQLAAALRAKECLLGYSDLTTGVPLERVRNLVHKKAYFWSPFLLGNNILKGTI